MYISVCCTDDRSFLLPRLPMVFQQAFDNLQHHCMKFTCFLVIFFSLTFRVYKFFPFHLFASLSLVFTLS